MDIKNELAYLSEPEQKASGLTSPILVDLLQPASLLANLELRATRIECRRQHPAFMDNQAPIIKEINQLRDDRPIIGAMILQLLEYQHGLTITD